MTEQRHILLVEDERPIADMVAYALKSEGYGVTYCSLGSEALEKMQNEAFDLVVMDVGLPDMSGFDVCRQARTFSDVPLLFLTARADEVDRIVGLEIGADDYVTKPFSPREVVARVRGILRRCSSPPRTGQSQWFDVNSEGGRITFCGVPLELTRYEYLLLKQLLQHPGRIYSRDLLMDSIWRDSLETSDRTVDTHVKTLRAKLRGVREDLDPIVTHRGMGYSVNNGSDR